MSLIKIILISIFIFGSFTIAACDNKNQKSKYQHPSVRSGAR